MTNREGNNPAVLVTSIYKGTVMDYQSIYDRIIERNRNTPKVKKQTEDHHIIPRSFAKLDGIEDVDGSWNRVNLPIREHFIVHLLLARIWRGHKTKGPKMAKAIRNMTNNGKYTSKDYSWLKLNYAHSEETKQKLRDKNVGKKLSAEHKRKISKANEGRIYSEQTRQKISNANKGKSHSGRIVSEETKQKISNANKGKSRNSGKTHSEETKQKIRNSIIARIRQKSNPTNPDYDLRTMMAEKVLYRIAPRGSRKGQVQKCAWPFLYK